VGTGTRKIRTELKTFTFTPQHSRTFLTNHQKYEVIHCYGEMRNNIFKEKTLARELTHLIID